MVQVKMATGVMLINAPASALNMQGMEQGRMAQNKVVVKKIRLNKKFYPYVSGQAVKRWWRESLYRKGWEPSPIAREEKVAYTSGDPISYPEDDLFGYMVAPAKGEGKGLVYRRVAPLKCTPFISIFGDVITDDFGVFARKPGEDPVPFEQEFYSTIMKGSFSLMLSEVGVFTRGRACDVPSEKDVDAKKKPSSFEVSKESQTSDDAKKKTDEKKDKTRELILERLRTLEEAAKKRKAEVSEGHIVLPVDERNRRAREALSVLPELSGGAKLTDYLTDVTPRVVIAAVIDCANHIFMDIVGPMNNAKGFGIHWETLEEVVKDYRKRFLTPIVIGFRKGFLDETDESRIANLGGFYEKFLAKDNKEDTEKLSKLKESDVLQIESGSPKEAIEKLNEHILKLQL